jgi:3-hydroxyisobutyrate dehydrogenase-like beta-hydroxyacid dehydrogenase
MKAPAPMLMQALSLYRLAMSKGWSELDSSAVVKVYS